MGRCVLDLGASVYLLPYSVYKQLSLGKLQPTNLILLLADRSVKISKGIVEDVILKVDEFYFHANIIILDTEPVINLNSYSPVILGRSFLTTDDVVIRCRNGVMTSLSGNMRVD